MKNRAVHPYTKLDSDYIDLRLLLHKVFAKKWLIVTISLLFSLLAVIYSEFKPARYQASMLLKIQHEQQNVLGAITNPSQQLSLANNATQSLAVQIALIQSEVVLRPVIKSLGLDTTKKSGHREQEITVLNRLRSNLGILDLTGSNDSPTNKMSLLRVSFSGADPALISNVLNQIAISAKQENINLKVKEAEKSLAFLLQQVPIVKKALNEAEEKLNIYRASSGSIDVKYQSQYLLNHLADLTKQLEVVQQKKQDLLQNYTEYHPLVIAINREIAQILKDRVKTTTQIKAAPAYEQDITNLNREVNVKNNLYMLLLNQIHQMQVIKSGIASDIEILTPASVPYVIQSINPVVIGVLTFIAGFLLSALGVLVWDIMTKRNNEHEFSEHVISITHADSKPSVGW